MSFNSANSLPPKAGFLCFTVFLLRTGKQLSSSCKQDTLSISAAWCLSALRQRDHDPAPWHAGIFHAVATDNRTMAALQQHGGPT